MVDSPPPAGPALADAPALALASAADHLACALLLLSPRGDLLYANHVGRALLRQGQWLHLDVRPDQARVVAASAAATCSLHQALAAAAAGVRQDLPLPPALRPARAVVTRLAPVPRGGQTDDGPGLLLMVSVGAGEGGAPVDISGYAEHHRLTAAETRVLTRLARGDTAATAATALGLGLSTVRTQIGSLRRKTGHASQADLARTLATLPPLRPLGQRPEA